MNKIKTYVITLSKNYMKGHPKAGQPTNFKEKFLSGEKIHTIRGNFPLWEKRIKEVQEGKAILSIREWIGVPYKEKQVVIKDLTCDDGVGIQPTYLDIHDSQDAKNIRMLVNDQEIESINQVAANDGLSLIDFSKWFFPKQTGCFDGGVIHFTKYRY